MTHILIVEDELRLRQDLSDFLELRGFEVTGAGTARDMRAALTDGPLPAVIILDVGLPDGNGFDLTKEIRQSHDCGIIMLTAFGDSADRVRGFDSGADIYLVKHSSLREVEAAIRSLLRRTGSLASATDRDKGRWILDTANWAMITPDGQALKLTATEFAFLHILCKRQGEVCPRDELVTALARPGGHFDNRHLDAIVSRLRRKLERTTNIPSAIKVVYGVGYTFTAHIAME
ncbi:DNA-binding response regulator [Sphingopyxis lindanitolerans]|uniref:DNA-binding response regulator n=1 Tax=Sphingopyxis lindanitolerans TaxID=2054227 RepID=A0A2S8B2X4_9SPHN|nr:response regulator transcription factor [Sphingopyxis lindanitolerans]PQM26658.1 DNA-binding response regulator [Sphingopyxis lindanitolerans]